MGALFLLIGIILSVISRWFEYEQNSEVGDVLLFPAIFFLALAFLCSFPYFKEWWDDPAGRKKAYQFMGFSAGGVLFLLLFVWFVFWQNEWLGALFLLPAFLCLAFLIRMFK